MRLWDLIGMMADYMYPLWLAEEDWEVRFESAEEVRACFDISDYKVEYLTLNGEREVVIGISKLGSVSLCMYCAYEGDCPNTVDDIEPIECGLFVDQRELWVD